jgi:hypothetical protein
MPPWLLGKTFLVFAPEQAQKAQAYGGVVRTFSSEPYRLSAPAAPPPEVSEYTLAASPAGRTHVAYARVERSQRVASWAPFWRYGATPSPEEKESPSAT